ncbi:hypothetical protein NXV01_25690 [Bacteroides sp. BFG-606]|nr:hypothetical protein [Bacteroides sp. BFG-606]
MKAPAAQYIVSLLGGGRLPERFHPSKYPVNRDRPRATLRVRGSIYNVTYIVDGMPRSINDMKILMTLKAYLS